jgi:GrpB-like predicted nucleotidyltransferase (UPF0157 family)
MSIAEAVAQRAQSLHHSGATTLPPACTGRQIDVIVISDAALIQDVLANCLQKRAGERDCPFRVGFQTAGRRPLTGVWDGATLFPLEPYAGA